MQFYNLFIKFIGKSLPQYTENQNIEFNQNIKYLI